MPQFAVLHVTKGSGTGSALGCHIDRIETITPDGQKKNNFNNADPARRHLNQEFVQEKFKKLSLAKAVSLRIKEGYNSRTKAGELKQISKDAVRFVEVNLTGSHERMKELELKGNEGLGNWVKENYKFCCEKYGKENIVRFTLHRDETTPHIHCVVVPLTTDGRLSAKEVIGNNMKLKLLQDDYAAAMKPFGLERGLEGSMARHTGKEEYIQKQNLAVREVEDLTVKGLFSTDKGKTIENLKNALIETKTRLKMRETANSNYSNDLVKMKKQISDLKKQVETHKIEILEQKKNATNMINKLLFDPAYFDMAKKEVEENRKRRREREKLAEIEKQNKLKNRGRRM